MNEQYYIDEELQKNAELLAEMQKNVNTHYAFAKKGYPSFNEIVSFIKDERQIAFPFEKDFLHDSNFMQTFKQDLSKLPNIELRDMLAELKRKNAELKKMLQRGNIEEQQSLLDSIAKTMAENASLTESINEQPSFNQQFEDFRKFARQNGANDHFMEKINLAQEECHKHKCDLEITQTVIAELHKVLQSKEFQKKYQEEESVESNNDLIFTEKSVEEIRQQAEQQPLFQSLNQNTPIDAEIENDDLQIEAESIQPIPSLKNFFTQLEQQGEESYARKNRQ
ncbi:hypothetical protein CCZ01_09150 [Helicobacter monodelphidis]|uniref:hypothetical protein n=1 Tax=Helicobacter sp. 15-1451 TaxID=2004995 RepID=UPI000DCDF909|nr:hypothetical protein [Helicobacter sp. 15-1451]RAX56563.1 hypothetical protein CCZ01_09150 [Helicobacter sp. 15-1451]